MGTLYRINQDGSREVIGQTTGDADLIEYEDTDGLSAKAQQVTAIAGRFLTETTAFSDDDPSP